MCLCVTEQKPVNKTLSSPFNSCHSHGVTTQNTQLVSYWVKKKMRKTEEKKNREKEGEKNHWWCPKYEQSNLWTKKPTVCLLLLLFFLKKVMLLLMNIKDINIFLFNRYFSSFDNYYIIIHEPPAR